MYIEAGLLIIGALAGGCSEEMEPHLPVLVPFFCQHISGNEVAEVRSIACWVTGRYAEWCIATLFSVCDSTEAEDGGEAVYRPHAFEPSSNCYDLALNALLPAILDLECKVQSAALSAVNAFLSSISGGTESELSVLLSDDRLQLIFQQIASAAELTKSNTYGVRNCLILCDLIAALCEAGGDLVASPQFISYFLPFVMHQYLNVFTDNSSVYLFPIMECVTAVIGAAGMHVHIYAMALMKRSIDIAKAAMELEVEERAHQSDGSGSSGGGFHLDFVVCSFDILGAMSECFVPPSDMASANLAPTNFSMLISEAGCGEMLGQLLVSSLSLEAEADVLQSAFALGGELFRTAMAALIQLPNVGPASPDGRALPNIIEQILARIVYYIAQPAIPVAVASNALWATGEHFFLAICLWFLCSYLDPYTLLQGRR